MKVTVIQVIIGVLETISKGFGNNRITRDHPNYNIIKIGQYTEKNLRDLQSLKFHWETIS